MMIHDNEVQISALKPCIFARRDIFRLARQLRELLEQIPESEREAFLRELMDDLELSATACCQDAIESPEYREPYYLMHGEEANWFWFCDQARSCCELGTAAAIAELRQLCDTVLTQYTYEESARPEHAREILEYLENRFSYLSKVLGSDGMMLLAFPSISGPGEPFACTALEQPGGAIDCETLILPDADEAFDPDYWVYDAAVFCLLLRLWVANGLSEDELSLLEKHWDRDIRAAQSEDQVEAYSMALLLGLSHEGPYGSFPAFEKYSKKTKAFWQRHVEAVIHRMGARLHTEVDV